MNFWKIKRLQLIVLAKKREMLSKTNKRHHNNEIIPFVLSCTFRVCYLLMYVFFPSHYLCIYNVIIKHCHLHVLTYRVMRCLFWCFCFWRSLLSLPMFTNFFVPCSGKKFTYVNLCIMFILSFFLIGLASSYMSRC